jgi:hypothetical protein
MTYTSLGLVTLLAAFIPAVAYSKPRPPDGWSASVDGLRGRLVLTASQDASRRPQLALAVELENTSDSAAPLEISAGSPSQMLKLTLEDEAGKPVERDMVGGNELTIPPYSLALPVRSTLVMTVAPAAYEYVPSGLIMLRPFSFVAWDMPAKRTGKLYLRATLAPVKPPADGSRAWKGPLELPRVPLP